jgi:hypothetical protein
MSYVKNLEKKIEEILICLFLRRFQNEKKKPLRQDVSVLGSTQNFEAQNLERFVFFLIFEKKSFFFFSVKKNYFRKSRVKKVNNFCFSQNISTEL